MTKRSMVSMVIGGFGFAIVASGAARAVDDPVARAVVQCAPMAKQATEVETKHADAKKLQADCEACLSPPPKGGGKAFHLLTQKCDK